MGEVLVQRLGTVSLHGFRIYTILEVLDVGPGGVGGKSDRVICGHVPMKLLLLILAQDHLKARLSRESGGLENFERRLPSRI